MRVVAQNNNGGGFICIAHVSSLSLRCRSMLIVCLVASSYSE